MPVIQPIVEGPGDVTAVPVLLRRILHEHLHLTRWQVANPINAQGCGNLLRPGGVERFVQRAQMEPGCTAILVLIDGDAANNLPSAQRPANTCPPGFADWLAQRIRRVNPRLPVVIVIARWEYEAWFLASIEAIAAHRRGGMPGLSPSARYEGDPENYPDPKAWINARLSRGYRYTETRDQVNMTRWIDLQITQQRARSFRRLVHAVQQIVSMPQNGQSVVTP